MGYRINLLSLGCEKNRVDSEVMLSILSKEGHKIVDDPNEADVGIINTCGFIKDAKEESIEEILYFIRLKRENKLKKIIISGCLSERYKGEILKEFPEVDAAIGIGAVGDIAKVVKEAMEGRTIEIFKDKCLLPLNADRMRTTPSHYAYLKISDGCSNCCTYCAIPQIRGSFRSRKIEDIIKEAESMANSGVKEIVIIAQDTTRYGEDIYGELKLPELLKKLCEIDKIKWIRLLYCYPDRLTDNLIDVIAKEDKIVKYIDLPLQHCNEKILKSMNRSGNVQSLKALLKKIRDKIPNVTLRTTFIVGFPGETDKEFTELCEFSKEIGFERMGCFKYSAEEGTKAAKFNNQVPEDIKNKRLDLIMTEQDLIMEQKARNMKGKEIEVLIDRFDPDTGYYYGRSQAEAPDDVDGYLYVVPSNYIEVKQGDIVRVLVKDYVGYQTICELI